MGSLGKEEVKMLFLRLANERKPTPSVSDSIERIYHDLCLECTGTSYGYDTTQADGIHFSDDVKDDHIKHDDHHFLHR